VAYHRDIKVVIRTPDGNFLRMGDPHWELTPLRERATVLDYLKHGVEAQLALIRKVYQTDLEAVPVPDEEVHETCDCCHQTIEPVSAFFDGAQFFCGSCRPSAPPK
jgi:hypothetical protein